MNVVRMMKEDEQKKILLNYIYLSRQHAGGKDQVAINLLEGICKNKDMGACVVLCYDYAKAYLEQIAPGVTVITVKPPKKESELVRLLDIERVNTWIVPKVIRKYNIGVVFHASCTNGLRKLKVPTVMIPHDIKAVSHRVMGSVKVAQVNRHTVFAVNVKNPTSSFINALGMKTTVTGPDGVKFTRMQANMQIMGFP